MAVSAVKKTSEAVNVRVQSSFCANMEGRLIYPRG